MGLLDRLIERTALKPSDEMQVAIDRMNQNPTLDAEDLRSGIDDEIDRQWAALVCLGLTGDIQAPGHGRIEGLKIARQLTGEAWKTWDADPSWHRYAKWDDFIGRWVEREIHLYICPKCGKVEADEDQHCVTCGADCTIWGDET